MSPALERYLEEDDPLLKILATGDDKGRHPASSHASADSQKPIEELEKHMKEHQGKYIINLHHKLR